MNDNGNISEAEQADRYAHAICDISLHLVRIMHSFNDADFVKECLVAVFGCISPELINTIKEIPLSAAAVAGCVKEMALDVKSAISTKLKNVEAFSVALDGGCDILDPSRIAVFVRGITGDMEIVEELVCFLQTAEVTDVDVFNALLSALKCLDLSKLVSINTDNALDTLHSENRLSQLLISHCHSAGYSQELYQLHSIFNQESLLATANGVKAVMSSVVEIVHTVLNRSRTGHVFEEMCKIAENEYGELLFQVFQPLWLSRSNILKCLFKLRHEMVSFANERDFEGFQVFGDEAWLCRFGFLTDISSHLNELEVKLQRQDVLFINVEALVQAFELKLSLWKKQLNKKDYSHFPHLAQCDLALVDTDECADVLTTLQNEFSSRFTKIRSHNNLQDLKIVSLPFEFPYDSAPTDVQLELIDLQASDVLLSKFKSSPSLIDFYSQLDQDQFPSLLNRAKRMISMFGSTYRSEQVFSKLKLGTVEVRLQLTHDQLDDVLLLNLSSCEPDVASVSKKVQPYLSL